MANWKTQLKWQIEAHKYSYEHGCGYEKEIEEYLEAENYHTLLKFVLDHDYSGAFDWLEKNG